MIFVANNIAINVTIQDVLNVQMKRNLAQIVLIALQIVIMIKAAIKENATKILDIVILAFLEVWVKNVNKNVMKDVI